MGEPCHGFRRGVQVRPAGSRLHARTRKDSVQLARILEFYYRDYGR